MTLRDGHLLEAAGPDDSGAFAEFDKWVADRVAQRTAAMADVMKAAGLTSPLPGLADMKGQGTFFAVRALWDLLAAGDYTPAISGKLPIPAVKRPAGRHAQIMQVKLHRPAQLSARRS